MSGWVMVVTDSAADADMLREAFTEVAPGARVSASVSAEEALVVLRSCVDRSAWPDVILTDYGLPSMDGIRFAELLASDAELADIPTIILAGGSSAVRFAQRSDWMQKPIEWGGWLSFARRIAERFLPGTAPMERR